MVKRGATFLYYTCYLFIIVKKNLSLQIGEKDFYQKSVVKWPLQSVPLYFFRGTHFDDLCASGMTLPSRLLQFHEPEEIQDGKKHVEKNNDWHPKHKPQFPRFMVHNQHARKDSNCTAKNR